MRFAFHSLDSMKIRDSLTAVYIVINIHCRYTLYHCSRLYNIQASGKSLYDPAGDQLLVLYYIYTHTHARVNSKNDLHRLYNTATEKIYQSSLSRDRCSLLIPRLLANVQYRSANIIINHIQAHIPTSLSSTHTHNTIQQPILIYIYAYHRVALKVKFSRHILYMYLHTRIAN